MPSATIDARLNSYPITAVNTAAEHAQKDFFSTFLSSGCTDSLSRSKKKVQTNPAHSSKEKIDSRVHRITQRAVAHERAGGEPEMQCHQFMRPDEVGGGGGGRREREREEELPTVGSRNRSVARETRGGIERASGSLDSGQRKTPVPNPVWGRAQNQRIKLSGKIQEPRIIVTGPSPAVRRTRKGLPQGEFGEPPLNPAGMLHPSCSPPVGFPSFGFSLEHRIQAGWTFIWAHVRRLGPVPGGGSAMSSQIFFAALRTAKRVCADLQTLRSAENGCGVQILNY